MNKINKQNGKDSFCIGRIGNIVTNIEITMYGVGLGQVLGAAAALLSKVHDFMTLLYI